MTNPLSTILLLFGVGFLAANAFLLNDYLAYRRRRRHAVLTWALPRPKTYPLARYIAIGLALVVVYKFLVLRWPLDRMFGELMMFVYYGLVYPLSFTVRRGFYEGGLWLERRFVRYDDITGLTWREGKSPRLIVVSGHQQRAGGIVVPGEHYGEARRLLRDRLKSHALHLQKSLLDLGGHDDRDVV